NLPSCYAVYRPVTPSSSFCYRSLGPSRQSRHARDSPADMSGIISNRGKGRCASRGLLGIPVRGAKGASAHVSGFVEALRSEGHDLLRLSNFRKRSHQAEWLGWAKGQIAAAWKTARSRR